MKDHKSNHLIHHSIGSTYIEGLRRCVQHKTEKSTAADLFNFTFMLAAFKKKKEKGKCGTNA